ncbi:hypothetical protein NON00_12995 [Roseomonas sp. GC11]|uniref:hypothetical protein n=1 Tax=Roseomonas sp. GC11 TaxID=2950546 RepID=UPI00210C9867|nr:hypothetical protein [Roseomonas sp. GC11]MCQ4160845.1 hypothetical protein [Roseomonas sp. GC11]
MLPFPTSLRVAASNVLGGCDYTSAIKEFLDHASRFGVAREILEDAPPHLPHPMHRAHLAAVAETLAELGGLSVPGWTEWPEFAGLDEPVPADPERRARLAPATPPAFARRGLYGPAMTALSRRMQATG